VLSSVPVSPPLSPPRYDTTELDTGKMLVQFYFVGDRFAPYFLPCFVPFFLLPPTFLRTMTAFNGDALCRVVNDRSSQPPTTPVSSSPLLLIQRNGYICRHFVYHLALLDLQCRGWGLVPSSFSPFWRRVQAGHTAIPFLFKNFPARRRS